ncbi:hypothetical protein IQ270_16285 [Microcoleus sp. LEGE 07076]|nr:hypothetical protein [Microcoleus sp. LEGE 07076]MBE9186202.1 hypothetical protein [Microcoleus sp. LEGE 07076]
MAVGSWQLAVGRGGAKSARPDSCQSTVNRQPSTLNRQPSTLNRQLTKSW